MDMMKTFAELSSAYGPSGAETDIAAVIKNLAAPYCDEMRQDTMGNLICHKMGSGPRIMFSAHMDSIGLVATHVEEKGYIRVGAIGGVTPANVLYTPVRFHNGTCGMVGADMGTDVSKLKMSEIFIDIGTSSREETEDLVHIGDVAVYNTVPTQVGTRVIAPYTDDRIACLVLLMAMEQLGETDNDLYFVFSVQEELGLRGAKTAAWGVDPDYGIALDVTPADDQPGSKHMVTSVLGGGAAVKVMDGSVICHPQMVSMLMDLAEQKGIKAQRDVIRAGGTDAGAIHQTRAGVCTGGISIPCRYVHTPAEMVDFDDVKACVELTVAFAETKLEKEC